MPNTGYDCDNYGVDTRDTWNSSMTLAIDQTTAIIHAYNTNAKPTQPFQQLKVSPYLSKLLIFAKISFKNDY